MHTRLVSNIPRNFGRGALWITIKQLSNWYQLPIAGTVISLDEEVNPTYPVNTDKDIRGT